MKRNKVSRKVRKHATKEIERKIWKKLEET